MADFSQIPWIAEHIKLYEIDPEKARLWDSTPLGGPGVLPTLLLTTTGRKAGEPRSRVAEGTERERLWKRMVEIYPPYTDYQKATERVIPVVVLDPA